MSEITEITEITDDNFDEYKELLCEMIYWKGNTLKTNCNRDLTFELFDKLEDYEIDEIKVYIDAFKKEKEKEKEENNDLTMQVFLKEDDVSESSMGTNIYGVLPIIFNETLDLSLQNLKDEIEKLTSAKGGARKKKKVKRTKSKRKKSKTKKTKRSQKRKSSKKRKTK